MPTSSSSRVPSYRRHKPTNQAVVTINGQDIYLGKWNTGASKAEYDRVGSKNSAEPCFPGAVTGSTDINCPHCGDLLTVTVPVKDPMGEESYQCSECSGAFEVDWGEGLIRYSVE